MHPLVLAGVLEWLVYLAGAATLAGIWCALPADPGFVALTLGILAAYLLAPSAMLLAAGLAVRLVPKPAVGTHPLPGEGEAFTRDTGRWITLLSLTTLPYRTPARWAATVWPLPAQLYFGVAGARIHATAGVPPHVVILDPYLVAVGARTVLGDGSKLSPHVVPRPGEVRLGPITIGDDVVIGGDCVIGPDVEIGDGATLVTRSGVLPGTRIGPGETWAGTPARRIARGPGSE